MWWIYNLNCVNKIHTRRERDKHSFWAMMRILNQFLSRLDMFMSKIEWCYVRLPFPVCFTVIHWCGASLSHYCILKMVVLLMLNEHFSWTIGRTRISHIKNNAGNEQHTSFHKYIHRETRTIWQFYAQTIQTHTHTHSHSHLYYLFY